MRNRDAGAWMWREASRWLEKIDRAERRRFAFVASERGEPIGWEPPADVYETELELWVVVALPGVEPESVEVELRGGALVVRGRRSLPSTLRRAAIRRLEIPYGRFERRIELPGAGPVLRLRELRNGCLVLGFEKAR